MLPESWKKRSMILVLSSAGKISQIINTISFGWIFLLACWKNKNMELAILYFKRPQIVISHGWKFKVSKILNFWNSYLKTRRMPTKMDNLRLKWLIVFICLVWFFTFYLQSFSYKGTGLLWPVKQNISVLNCDYFLIHQFKHMFWCSKEQFY